jgi:hypothetical protein
MAGKYRRLLMAEAAASARQLAQEQVVIAPSWLTAAVSWA